MMKRETALLLGVLCLAYANEEALQAVTRGNNLFSSRLYDAIGKNTNGNLVVSPLSVATAVAMLQAGARGETAQAIRSALNFPADDQLNAGYRSLIQELQSDGNITFEMANKLYPAEDFEMRREFSSTLKNYFGAEPHQLNFVKNLEAAKEINSFVSQSTHGKIRDLIDAADLNDRTKLVLINAIYFKGKWEQPFPQKDTVKMDFYTNETDSVKVDMMRLQAYLRHGEIPELDATAVFLPYEGGSWGMIILLPNKRSGLWEMENQLKSVPLEKIMKSLKTEIVYLDLPRFKMESTIDLQAPLTQLGAGLMFNQARADLSGIPVGHTPLGELFVSKAVQKAFIEVNEEGSEGGASTALIFGSKTNPLKHHVVQVDHPFYSMILQGDFHGFDNEQLSPVFVQRVVHP